MAQNDRGLLDQVQGVLGGQGQAAGAPAEGGQAPAAGGGLMDQVQGLIGSQGGAAGQAPAGGEGALGQLQGMLGGGGAGGAQQPAGNQGGLDKLTGLISGQPKNDNTVDGYKDQLVQKAEDFVESQQGKHGAQVDGILKQADTYIDGYQGYDKVGDVKNALGLGGK